MQLTITLPDRDKSLAFQRQRWCEILDDDYLAQYRGRIETNALGHVIMSPPASGDHSTRQGNIVFELRLRLGGVAKPECPVATSDGTKAIDVSWYSATRHADVRGQKVFERAGEICVEIKNPRNSLPELENKRTLYFEAGAIECWLCDQQGVMTYYRDNDPQTAHEQSSLCPDFPAVIKNE